MLLARVALADRIGVEVVHGEVWTFSRTRLYDYKGRGEIVATLTLLRIDDRLIHG